MHSVFRLFIYSSILVLVTGCVWGGQGVTRMEIVSTAIKSGEKIAAQFTCDGTGINPPLSFINVPEVAQSLVLIVDDPDAPKGTFLHWTIWNMDPKVVNGIAAGSVPLGGIQGMTDFGKPGWGGPCPPSGTHRYYFKLFALDTMLDLQAGAPLQELQTAMQEHVVEQAELMGTYTRN